MASAMVDTSALERRIDAAHDGAAHRRRMAQHGVGIEKRRGADEPGRAVELPDTVLPVLESIAAAADTVACADKLSRRPRSSLSNPFMTEMTVIRASTPTATPSKRYPGDEGDEKAVLAGQGVAQAHEHWNGLKHFAAH